MLNLHNKQTNHATYNCVD